MRSLPGVEEFLEGSPASIFESVVERCSAAMNSPVCMLLLDHLDLVDFYITSSYPETPDAGEIPFKVETRPLLEVFRDHATLCAPAAQWQVAPFAVEYLSGAPIRLRDTVIGVMLCGGESPHSEEELDSLRRLGMKAGVALSVADQYTDRVEVSRRRAEPSIAAELQSDQLPPRALYTSEAQVVGGIEPVYDVGGDWFDYALDHERLFVAVCDGVGRGLSAASISYVTLGAVRNARKIGCSLEQTMQLAHEALIASTSYEQFATLLLANIDLRTLEMDLISAAHPAPILMPGRENSRAEIMQLPHDSYPPLGAFEEGREYVSGRYELSPGCRLLFFSDGATERRGVGGKRLGMSGLLDYIEQSREVGKLELLRFLMSKVEEFGESPVEDDVTIVGLDLPPFA